MSTLELEQDLPLDKEYPVVESVIKNSPADKAGLAKGDKLWDIDGVDLLKNSAYVVNLIQNSKSPYIMLYYFDKSEGFSKRVSIYPGLIVDQEEEQRKKKEEEQRKKEEEQRKKEEEQEKKREIVKKKTRKRTNK